MSPAPQTLMRKLVVVLFLLGLLAALVAAAAGYLYLQATANVDPSSLGTPSLLDGEEASRKLKQFEDSLKNNKKGYIRLTDQEINSLIHKRFFSESTKGMSNQLAVCQLQAVRVHMMDTNVSWHAWVRREIGGRKVSLLWTRTGVLHRGKTGWEFALQSMRLGRLKIPEQYWAGVTEQLRDADSRMVDLYNWVMHLPSIEIKPNEISRVPELILYNYSDAAASVRGIL